MAGRRGELGHLGNCNLEAIQALSENLRDLHISSVVTQVALVKKN
jgi:hypothetical protein